MLITVHNRPPCQFCSSFWAIYEGNRADLPSRNVRLQYRDELRSKPSTTSNSKNTCSWPMCIWISRHDRIKIPFCWHIYQRVQPCSHTPSLACLVLSLFHLCLNSWATQFLHLGVRYPTSSLQNAAWKCLLGSMHSSTARPKIIYWTDTSYYEMFNLNSI